MEYRSEIDATWHDRSEFWRTHEPKRGRGPKQKFAYRTPLILCGHGVDLRIDHGTLLVRDGFTHYPQKRNEHRFFRGDPDLPDRVVILDSSGSVTFDALGWMSEQGITLVHLNWRGEINVVGGPTGLSAKRSTVECQLAAQHGACRLRVARWLVHDKIAASIDTLRHVFHKLDGYDTAADRLKRYLRDTADASHGISLAKLLGIEGSAAAAYFRSWHGLPLQWSNTKRHPIPDSWHRVGPRKMGWRDNGRNARHPVNAMLNYGYGMLASQVRIQAVAAGLDPTIGIMHGSKDNRIPLVYDLMEPLRPAVDRAILRFALDHRFSPGDFAINRWGGCRLNPQMARAVAKQVSDLSANGVVTEFIRLLRS